MEEPQKKDFWIWIPSTSTKIHKLW